MKSSILRCVVLVLSAGLLGWLPGVWDDCPARGEDWPMWRYDANRSAASPQELAGELHLQWTREFPALEPAWEDAVNRDRMPFDRVYEPVVVGSVMFFGSNRNDAVTALNARTGEEIWRFYADGPVRLPPAAWEGNVYFASDDGHLYCLDAQSGKLIRKLRGGPDGRKVIGNSRMISAWPARGGPVIKDGVVYFAAGIWPFMGTFIYAVDARTGEVLWTNEKTGSTYMDQPHGSSASFGGVAPQGALCAVGDRLLVPGGRSVPACLIRSTGEVDYYHLGGSKYHQLKASADRRREGASHVSAGGRFFLNHRGLNTSLYDLESGEMIQMWKTTTYPVVTDRVLYLSGNPVVAYDLTKRTQVGEGKNARWELEELWRCDVDGTQGLIKAGSRLYAGGRDVVSAIQLPDDGTPTVVWQVEIDGAAARLLAADDRLFVVTLDGRFYAFGADENSPGGTGILPVSAQRHWPDASGTRTQVGASMPDETELARAMLDTTTVSRGYCLVFGLSTGNLAEAIARCSEFRVVAVDPDAEKVAALRRRFDDLGLYGSRISLQVGDPTTFRAPPYVAALTVSENLQAAAGGTGMMPVARVDEEFLEQVFRSMRPYGGVAFLPVANKDQGDALTALAEKCDLAGLKVSRRGRYVVLIREGPLPGAADWTHQNGDVANTSKSDDRLVKLPLGVLWFGGSSHDDILPRHGHGPPEQVVGGRLFIEGTNSLSARDVYTGRVLWKRDFEDLGTFDVYYDKSYDPDPLDTSYNQVHIPGANARGANYVVCRDKLYLVVGSQCRVLDPATGNTQATFSLPPDPNTGESPSWGYLGVYQDLLIASSQIIRFSNGHAASSVWENFDTCSSKALVVMDRHSGEVLWQRDSELAFRHNAIAVGAGKLFCVDRLPDLAIESAKRRGETPHGEPRLLCLDVRTGTPIWSTTENVFGTWLGYSQEHDILIQCGRHSRDMLRREPNDRMIAYRGQDGAVVWDQPVEHSGPCMIHHDTIYLNAYSTVGSAVNLLTGAPSTRKHPLTGREIPWQYHRHYGCNSVVASEHLLTFRSGAAGYYDLASESGTGNLGGFKSGCTANLIAADGVLNAPDYTRTCTCPYQNQTSLALVHVPDVETWTFDEIEEPEDANDRIVRVGINLGAPGDRRDNDGTLWLEHPIVGGPSPHVDVEVPGSTTYFRRHSSRISGQGEPWIAASGVEGAREISVRLVPGQEAGGPVHRYTVRLHFMEPDATVEVGQRVFDVALQGKVLLRAFDPLAETHSANRSVVKQFTGIPVEKDLVVAFNPTNARGAVLCGIEAVAEEP